MRALVRTLIIRDREGYEVRAYGDPDPKTIAEKTLLGAPPSGIHIVGRSGKNETHWLQGDRPLRLWQTARKLRSPKEVATFMTRWGQLTRWLGDDGSRPYEESFLLIEPHMSGLRRLADFVDAGDKVGFSLSLNENKLVSRADIVIDTS